MLKTWTTLHGVKYKIFVYVLVLTPTVTFIHTRIPKVDLKLNATKNQSHACMAVPNISLLSVFTSLVRQ